MVFQKGHKINLGKKWIEESRNKLSIAHKGKHHSINTEFKKGHHFKTIFKKNCIPWNKGIKGYSTAKKGKHFPELLNIYKNKKVSKEARINMSNARLKGIKEERIVIWNKGRYFPELSGKNSASWLGGLSFEPYDSNFNKFFKNQIRNRDNQVCMNCGIHREKTKRALCVHHINYDKKLTAKENCICLCDICHTLTNQNRPYWTKLFQDKLNKLYNYKYDNQSNIIINMEEEK